MIQQEFLISNLPNGQYRGLFDLALKASPDYVEFYASCAYATRTGVTELENRFRAELGDHWRKVKKSWIIGIDYCRSDPIALDYLASLPLSKVKVPHGKLLVKRRLCVPIVTFHPKAFMFTSDDTTSLVVGSGNLSRAAMLTGIEAGSVTVAKSPHPAGEKPVVNGLENIRQRIQRLWNESTPYANIAADYLECYNANENLKNPSPTDDDGAETALTASRTGRKRGEITAQQFKQMRACQNLWIDAGNLHENRGEDKPGNQLMLSRMTRVFFGFPAKDLPKDTTIGSVAIVYAGQVRNDCSMRFSNNSMDVLTLPIPETEGPDAYDQESLLFRTVGLNRFELTVGTAAQRKQWEKKSEAIDASYRMSSGRQWGVF